MLQKSLGDRGTNLTTAAPGVTYYSTHSFNQGDEMGVMHCKFYRFKMYDCLTFTTV